MDEVKVDLQNIACLGGRVFEGATGDPKSAEGARGDSEWRGHVDCLNNATVLGL